MCHCLPAGSNESLSWNRTGDSLVLFSREDFGHSSLFFCELVWDLSSRGDEVVVDVDAGASSTLRDLEFEW